MIATAAFQNRSRLAARGRVVALWLGREAPSARVTTILIGFPWYDHVDQMLLDSEGGELPPDLSSGAWDDFEQNRAGYMMHLTRPATPGTTESWWRRGVTPLRLH